MAALAQGRSLRLNTDLSDQLIASEQEMADLFAESHQIAAAPDFAAWVDRRYSDALSPYYVKRN